MLALFYQMTKHNRTIRDIIHEMNQQLKEAMPVGRFVAATIVCLHESERQGEIWVGGTPEALLINTSGTVSRRFPSDNLPLGIVDNPQLDANPINFTWSETSQLILCSDGLLEATDRNGEQFGMERLIQAAAGTVRAERFTCLEAALTSHLDGVAAQDDVSLMLVDCS